MSYSAEALTGLLAAVASEMQVRDFLVAEPRPIIIPPDKPKWGVQIAIPVNANLNTVKMRMSSALMKWRMDQRDMKIHHRILYRTMWDCKDDIWTLAIWAVIGKREANRLK